MRVSVPCEPLSRENFAPYGHVVMATGTSKSANMGTARRFNHLARLENRREGNPACVDNVCVFHSIPTDKLPDFPVELLERHPFSTQMFVPMGSADARYLVIVALGGDKPDLSTLKAFVATGSQAINYGTAIWHHPMITLDTAIDFTVIVYEDGTNDDCHVIELSHLSADEFIVSVPPKDVDQ